MQLKLQRIRQYYVLVDIDSKTHLTLTALGGWGKMPTDVYFFVTLQ